MGLDTPTPAWPGYLVSGPNPKATDWKDDQRDARLNEVAINWNAALIYALAGDWMNDYVSGELKAAHLTRC